MKIAANYEITGIRVNPVGGSIEALEINHEEVSVGAASLQNNKEATIDVSTYTEPVEITPASGKDGMKKATITLSNIPSGADLEANKAATIDVSTYSTPVDITPTEGKDGMEKVTITLDNIPSGGSSTLYAWVADDPDSVLTSALWLADFDVCPDSFTGHAYIASAVDESSIEKYTILPPPMPFVKVSDTKFTVGGRGYTRDNTKDITLW